MSYHRFPFVETTDLEIFQKLAEISGLEHTVESVGFTPIPDPPTKKNPNVLYRGQVHLSLTTPKDIDPGTAYQRSIILDLLVDNVLPMLPIMRKR